MRKILWVAADQMGVGTYRCWVPALSLKEAGVADSEFIVQDKVSFENLDLRGIDLAVFQRPAFPHLGVWMRQCVDGKVPFLVELDDNMWNVPRTNPAHHYWAQPFVKNQLHYALEHAAKVVVSTRPLAEIVREQMGWPDWSRLRVCHNHLHPAVWGVDVWGGIEPYDNLGKVVIGWQGSKTHDTDFKMALAGLQRVVEEFPNVTVRFLGCVPQSVKGHIPGNRYQWAKGVPFTQYPTMLRHVHFDIGIAPLTDATFNRSKSNIKWLEYSALSIPCVASAVYPYARSIQHGVNGFLARTPDEWYEHLKGLVLSEERRKAIGEAACQTVWKDWSDRQHAPAWFNVINEVVPSGVHQFCYPELQRGAGMRPS